MSFENNPSMPRKTGCRGLVPAAVAFGVTLVWAGSASAQSVFGTRGQLVVTAEDLFELSTQTAKFKSPAYSQDYSNTTTRFGFLYSGRQDDEVTVAGPKVGVHYFVAPRLSIGGTLGYESRGGSRSVPTGQNTTQTTDKGEHSSFLLLPKVGYTLMFTPVVGFWFRGGLGYSNTKTDNPIGTGSASAHYWLLSLEAPLIVSPLPHVAFYVGPSMDVGFIGSLDQTNEQGVTTSFDSSYFGLSLNVGLMGYFDLL